MPSTTPRPRDPDSLYFRGLPEGWENDRALVTRTQRERMLDAMARAVAAKGYAKLTVSDVVALAGVSRRTFYEQFADKEECFLESYAAGAGAIIRRGAGDHRRGRRRRAAGEPRGLARARTHRHGGVHEAARGDPGPRPCTARRR